MTTVVCDVTKKAIPNAQRDVNYVTMLDKTLSMPAVEEFEKRVRENMRSNKQYSFAVYKKVYRDVLNQMCK